MKANNNIFAIEKKAIVSGLFAFIIIVLLFPFLATFIASLGPVSLFYDYIEPLRKFKSVLFVLVGMVTFWKSTHTPIKNSAIVAFVGGCVLVLISVALGYYNHMAHIQNIIIFVVFCVLGSALCVLLSRRTNQTFKRDA